jgi:hypothetical protein
VQSIQQWFSRGPQNPYLYELVTAAETIAWHSRNRISNASGKPMTSKPHLTRTFKLSNDPQFKTKFRDVIGRYLDPPTQAVVLSCDQKSQCQALNGVNPDCL